LHGFVTQHPDSNTPGRCPDHGGAGSLPASFFISVAGLAKRPVLGGPPVIFSSLTGESPVPPFIPSLAAGRRSRHEEMISAS